MALLATDVADSENALPEKLRAQIIYLAEFTLQHTSKVLSKGATADVLIEINTSIMRGCANRRSGMSGLILKLGPKERVLINGAVIENGDRRSRFSVVTPNAKILRLRDAIHPDEVNTPVQEFAT